MKIFISAILCLSISTSTLSQANFKNYEQQIPGTGMNHRMVAVTGGSFLMGTPASEPGRDADEGPQKKVEISSFWMGAFEVSRDEFDVFYKDESTSQNAPADAITRPSPQYIDFSLGMGKEGGYPVNSLSQYAALMYCRWLYQKTGIFYRLPTSAEWEYACRAGSTSTYPFGNDAADLEKYAWYAANSSGTFKKTGQKAPNAWGLYDMLGNVTEWTIDHYEEDALQRLGDKTKDPMVPFNPMKYPKLLKGGSYSDDAPQLRSGNRISSDPSWNVRDPQIPKSKWWLTEAGGVGLRIIRPYLQPSAADAETFYNTYLGR